MKNQTKMRFVFSNSDYEEKAKDFICEFDEYESESNGSGGLDRYLNQSTYEEWLKKIMGDIDIANIEPGRVPALTYFYVREENEKVIGMINVRLVLNAFLREEGGHIGYCIRPTERGKGYATRMLEETLNFCGSIGLTEFVLTCDQSNIASACVIQRCGGRLEAEFYSETFPQTIQRYRIFR